MTVTVIVTVMRQGEVCQAVTRGTSVIVPPVPVAVAVVSVALDVDGVLSVELWLVMLILEMEAG